MILPRGLAVLLASIVWLASPAPAEANHEGLVLAGMGGLVLGHATLLPSYVAVAHYAANDHKRMPAGWFVMNLLSSAASGTLGIALVGAGIDGMLSGDINSRQAGMVAAVSGSTLVAGATLVVIASANQRGRPEAPGRLAIAPAIGPRGEATLAVFGRF